VQKAMQSTHGLYRFLFEVVKHVFLRCANPIYVAIFVSNTIENYKLT
jgi:hypothetical protein